MMRIIDAVTEIRKMDPGLGYFKLWLMLKRMFLSDWVPGRDAFLSIMRQFGLMLSRPKPRHTTNSNHRYHKYRNLIRGYVPTASNQLWVSDIHRFRNSVSAAGFLRIFHRSCLSYLF